MVSFAPSVGAPPGYIWTSVRDIASQAHQHDEACFVVLSVFSALFPLSVRWRFDVVDVDVVIDNLGLRLDASNSERRKGELTLGLRGEGGSNIVLQAL